jgi:hypothetical protein
MLLVLAALAASVAPVPERAQARATVRVLRSSPIAAAQWDAAEHRTSRIVREGTGPLVQLRIVDFE